MFITYFNSGRMLEKKKEGRDFISSIKNDWIVKSGCYIPEWDHAIGGEGFVKPKRKVVYEEEL